MKRLVFLAVFLLISASAWSETLHVPDPYPTIQAAVDDAGAGDTVLVAPGDYSDVTHEAGDGDTTKCAVIMRSDITLMGSGIGQTTIDADSLGRGIHCSGVTGSTIRDFTIRGAFAENYGAAIFCTNGSSPAIENCEIIENWDGGIICLFDSSPTIQSCPMLLNLAKQGGGIAIEDGCSPEVRDCLIQGNGAPSGAGIFIRDNSLPVIEDCIVEGNIINAANGSGGGIAIVNASPEIRRVKVVDNISSGGGGGIAVFDCATTLISDCEIIGNSTTASYGPGGGIFANFASPTIEGTLIAENDIVGSAADGGGISLFFGDALISHCTIASNTIGEATHGGGIHCNFSSPMIDKCIIAFNDETGLYCADESTPTVSCTDIYGNPDGNDICGVDAGGNFSLDPRFCNVGEGDYRVHLDSPCAPGNHPEGPQACGGDLIGSEDAGCSSAIEDATLHIGHHELVSSQPNPFGSATSIYFRLTHPARAALQVFDVTGRCVRAIDNGVIGAGSHRIVWDGRDDSGRKLPSGIYLFQLNLAGDVRTGRMVIAR